MQVALCFSSTDLSAHVSGIVDELINRFGNMGRFSNTLSNASTRRRVSFTANENVNKRRSHSYSPVSMSESAHLIKIKCCPLIAENASFLRRLSGRKCSHSKYLDVFHFTHCQFTIATWPKRQRWANEIGKRSQFKNVWNSKIILVRDVSFFQLASRNSHVLHICFRQQIKWAAPFTSKNRVHFPIHTNDCSVFIECAASDSAANSDDALICNVVNRSKIPNWQWLLLLLIFRQLAKCICIR